MKIVSRRLLSDDQQLVSALVEAAFNQPDESRIVDRLRAEGDMAFEYVSEVEGKILGHVALSTLGTTSGPDSLSSLALAPVAVHPDYQTQGIGQNLIRHALADLIARHIQLVVVLGRPSYYSRFGFSSERARLLKAPYSGDSLMALELQPGCLGSTTWQVSYAPAFSA